MNQKGRPLTLALALALILLPALLSLLSKAQTVHAATFVVTIFNDENDTVCDASCSIRDAIFVAGNGDDITIPAGTYTLSATNGTLTVSKSLTFNGNSATDTIIDAEGTSRVFNVTAGTVTFNDLTVQNGVALDGAGIRISGPTTSVTLANSVVFSNSATTSGGGIYLQSGALSLQSSNVLTNTAVTDGGGVYNLRGTVTVDNSTVNYNIADRAGGIFVNQASAALTVESGEISFNTGNNIDDVFSGGGITVLAGSATVNGGEIRGNSAFRGGGILVTSGSLTFNDGQIIDNESNYGGGLYVRETTGTATINGGSITQNRSTASIFGGGGIYIFQGLITMNGGDISSNTAVNDGGAMEIGDAQGRFTLNNGEIFSNSAGKMGGAIYAAEGTLTVNGGMIHTNDSVTGGGAIATGMGSQSTIQNAALLTNTTTITSAGGAIKNAGTLTMTNVTMSGNSAGSGAGLNNSGTAVLTHVTVSENTASVSGGGLNNASGTLTVGNSILFNNSSAVGADCNGTIVSVGNNLSTCGLAGSGDSSSDPLLQPLALNGGETLNYALGASSPAIDSGNSATCPTVDQRGNLRPVGSTCDIGAFEAGIGFFISDASLTEGDAGSSQMSFIVSRSFMTSTTYMVDYATLDGSALAGLDYTAVSTTTLTFPPATMTQTVNIPILGDLLDEADELFSVELSNPTGASQLGNASGSGTILDNDAPPSLTVGDVVVTEGTGGTVTAVFTATLSAESGKTITVNYDTMDGTAVAPDDYTTASGTLTFIPGVTQQSAAITINSDTLDEFDETVSIALSNESNVTLSGSTVQLTITDDDAQPSLTIANASVTEGNSGTTNANFVVTLSAPSGKPITVNYITAANTAAAGTDYVIANNTLTISPGFTSGTISVLVIGDTIDENDETFTLNLTGASNVTLPAMPTATGTIIDDDPLPTATINDVTVTEGNNGSTVTAVFTVSLSHASAKVITINYSSANGSATAGEDYTAVPASVLTFNAGGSLSQTISVTVQGDDINELTEQFFINLTGSSNAILGNSQGVGTITDDDGSFLFLPLIVKP